MQQQLSPLEPQPGTQPEKLEQQEVPVTASEQQSEEPQQEPLVDPLLLTQLMELESQLEEPQQEPFVNPLVQTQLMELESQLEEPQREPLVDPLVQAQLVELELQDQALEALQPEEPPMLPMEGEPAVQELEQLLQEMWRPVDTALPRLWWCHRCRRVRVHRTSTFKPPRR